MNLITVHDGFTLRDLVSYDRKHNEANGESNRDGTDDNRSWNCGVEGPTDDPGVLALRARQSRAMLTTLLLSFGIPMLLGGDELGRTQQGNNNPYCQDNEISWFDWSDVDSDLLAFTRRAGGLPQGASGVPPAAVPRRRRAAELGWFTPAGTAMTVADWSDRQARAVALYLDGSDEPDRAADGSPLIDDDFLVLVNAWWQPLGFTIPPSRTPATAPPGPAVGAQSWQLAIVSYDPARPAGAALLEPGDKLTSSRRSSCSAIRCPPRHSPVGLSDRQAHQEHRAGHRFPAGHRCGPAHLAGSLVPEGGAGLDPGGAAQRAADDDEGERGRAGRRDQRNGRREFLPQAEVDIVPDQR